ncbi:MAG: hypothetical protein KA035_01700 [Candidatus Levybacteria bacterium]|nr:hypothetical protein [Candidatus Levybacteria bacterium]
MAIERREISPERKLALTGMGMFVDVSGKYPANFAAQGADIAMRCKQRLLNPQEIEKSLAGSHDLLLKIAQLADAAHGNGGPGYEMTTGRVAKSVRDDFVLAGRIMHLEDADLKKFLNRRYRITFLMAADDLMTKPVTPEMIADIIARDRFIR